MKSTKDALQDLPFLENPRSLDRLLTACMIVLALLVLAMAIAAINQQQVTQRTEEKTIKIEMPTQNTATIRTENIALLGNDSTQPNGVQ